MLAVALKHSVFSDGRRSCKFTHRRKDDVRGSQAPSLFRRPPLM